MMQNISVALIGLGGFAGNYAKALLSEARARNVSFVAGVDPMPERCSTLADLKENEIPLYRTIDEYVRRGAAADLIAIATPLQLHCEQVVQALQAGSHVICEKPLGAGPDQARQMIRARDQAGKMLAIAYQWSFAPVTQQVKADVLSGRFGAPLRAATVTCWPRDSRYYQRNNWAGRIHDDQGRLVLDSPANNACAHFLHHMFYLLGPTLQTSALPASVTSELYRAHEIENYDTAAIRCTTTTGVELLFLASHVTQQSHEPICRFEFEKATLIFGEGGDRVRAHFHDGKVQDLGKLPHADSMDKLWTMVDCVRTGRPVPCGVEAASSQTLAICAVQESVQEIRQFPRSIVRRKESSGGYSLVVEGLEQTLLRCYQTGQMPHELGLSWARGGKPTLVEQLLSDAVETLSASA